eukprot:COSAG01_NODE_970_length_12375_cov_27.268736_4_plen_656_part_00
MARGGAAPTCTHSHYSQAPKSILNPRSADAPLSRVLLGCTNGFRIILQGVLYHFMGACGRAAPAARRDAMLAISVLTTAGLVLAARSGSDAVPPPGNPGAQRYRGCAAAYPGCPWQMPDPRGSGDPGGVPLDFSCAYRAFAAEFASHLRPDADPTLVFDALQLGTLCQQTRPSAAHRPAAAATTPSSAQPEVAAVVYVAVDGSDDAPGTRAAPKRTIAEGLAATRALLPAGRPRALRIGGGTYHLDTPLVLTAADSHLTIAASGTGAVWVSGARPLPTGLRWQRSSAPPPSNVWSARLPRSFTWPGNGLSGRQLRLTSPATAAAATHSPPVLRAHRARHPNGDPELDYFQSWYYTNAVGNIASPRPNETYWLPPNGCPGVDGTSTCRWPACAAYHRDDTNLTGCTLSIPSGLIAAAGFDDVELSPTQYGGRHAAQYGGGYGCNASGPWAFQCGCNAFDPPTSLWCSGFGGNNWQRPSGLHIDKQDWNDTAPWISAWKQKPKSGEDPVVVHAMDWGHWASLMFEVAETALAADGKAATMRFGRGGFQGAQGGNASSYYIENQRELLDDVHEFYYDAPMHTLFFHPNSSDSPPTAGSQLSAPVLQTLLRTTATQAEPIVGLTIDGIGFRDAAPSFLHPHAVPSGGEHHQLLPEHDLY